MSWNSGPMIGADAPDGSDPGDALLWLILDYGQACFEHGIEQAKYEVARARSASADISGVNAAGQRAIVAYARLRSAMEPVVPLLVRSSEPGE